jgi:PII-like signaling protein
VSDDCVKLTTYFGERARADGGFLADALVDVYARHRLETSIVMRGVEGFGAAPRDERWMRGVDRAGAKQQLRTDRLLTLSEDLPMVAVAVDRTERIEAALADVQALPRFSGLVTVERALMLTGTLDADISVPGAATKLTVHLGRHERAGGRPAAAAVVDLLHRCGVAGATVLLGVDGTAHGDRHRARFFARNAQVPLMVVAVGDGDRIAGVLPELGAMLPRPLVTLEAVQLCKRDGARIAAPTTGADIDPAALQKVMVFASELSQHAGAPLHRTLIRELRRAGAAGATSLRGIWGYHGDHAPHGDTFWQLRRRVPVVVTIIDTPVRMERWFAVVDHVTDEAGLVTSELVGTATGSVALTA